MRAARRAEQLLSRVIGDVGYKLFKERGWMEVRSKLYRSRVYHLAKDGSLHFSEHGGKQWIHLCVHPGEDVPVADRIATLYLYLMNDEAALLRIANEGRISFLIAWSAIQEGMQEQNVPYPDVVLGVLCMLCLVAPLGLYSVYVASMHAGLKLLLGGITGIASLIGVVITILVICDIIVFFRRLMDRRDL